MKYILIILLFISCKKEEQKDGYVTFYKSSGESRNVLYVDNVYSGTLNRINYIPDCMYNIKNEAITIKLSYGNHTYFMTDSNNINGIVNLKVSETCKIVSVK